MIFSQESLEAAAVVSRHNEPQPSPQEWDCGCVTAAYVTDRSFLHGENPFEMRLAHYCDKADCEIRRKFYAADTRDLAVALVDFKYGYSYEFAGSPTTHRDEYDEVEASLLAAQRTDPHGL